VSSSALAILMKPPTRDQSSAYEIMADFDDRACRKDMTVTYGGHVLMLSLDPFNVLDPYAGQPAAASIKQVSCRHLATLLAACETVCRGTSLLFGAVEASITAHCVS